MNRYISLFFSFVIIQTDTIMDFAMGLKTWVGHFYREVQNMELFWEVGRKVNSK